MIPVSTAFWVTELQRFMVFWEKKFHLIREECWFTRPGLSSCGKLSIPRTSLVDLHCACKYILFFGKGGQNCTRYSRHSLTRVLYNCIMTSLVLHSCNEGQHTKCLAEPCHILGISDVYTRNPRSLWISTLLTLITYKIKPDICSVHCICYALAHLVSLSTFPEASANWICVGQWKCSNQYTNYTDQLAIQQKNTTLHIIASFLRYNEYKQGN